MTKCNRFNSDVSFKKEDISNDDYYCACLECDEDLFKIETYETKKEVIMNNTNKMKCPMCEEGAMEYKNIKGLHTYSCEVCPFQGIEGIDYTIEDLIGKATKGENKMKYLTKEEKRVAILDLLSEFEGDVVIDTLSAYISLDSCVELYHDLENEGYFGEEDIK